MASISSASPTTHLDSPSIGAPVLYGAQSAIDFYSGDTTLAGIKRGVKYFQEIDTTTKVKLIFISTATIAVATATGALAGGTIGGAIGTLVEPGGGTAVGAGTGAAIGGVIGGAVGALYSTYVVTVEISRSNHYENWKRRALSEKIYPLFQEVLESEEFGKLVCPITSELPRLPVLAPCKHVFEKSEIEKWLKSKPEDAHCCPLRCRERFTAEDLVYSQDRIDEITNAAKARIQVLTQQHQHDIKIQGSSIELVHALTGVMRDGREHSLQVFKQVLNKEIDVSVEGNLSEADFATVASKTYSKYLSAHLASTGK